MLLLHSCRHTSRSVSSRSNPPCELFTLQLRRARRSAQASKARPGRVFGSSAKEQFLRRLPNRRWCNASREFERRGEPRKSPETILCNALMAYTGHNQPPVDPQTTKAARSSPLRGSGCPLPGNTVCHAVPLVPLGNPKTMTSKQRESSKKRARRKENQKPKPSAKPPTKQQAQKTKRRLQSLRRRAERQDRTPKLTRRDEHSSLAKSLGVRSLDLFRSFCPHESF